MEKEESSRIVSDSVLWFETCRKKRPFHICRESGNARLSLETSILKLKANSSRGKKVARQPASFTDTMKGKPTTTISHT
jgi:hypothetical protein